MRQREYYLITRANDEENSLLHARLPNGQVNSTTGESSQPNGETPTCRGFLLTSTILSTNITARIELIPN